jgi:hypothetical protein
MTHAKKRVKHPSAYGPHITAREWQRLNEHGLFNFTVGPGGLNVFVAEDTPDGRRARGTAKAILSVEDATSLAKFILSKYKER